MKLTDSDLFAHDHGLIVKCTDWEKTGKQILKNQELAEKWLKITENPNWVKGTREFSELYEIVELLKKLLDSPLKHTQSQLYQELQKIIGEK